MTFDLTLRRPRVRPCDSAGAFFLISLALALPAAGQLVHDLGAGVSRFDLDGDARAAAVPSMSFVEPARRESGQPVTSRPAVPLRFAQDRLGRQVVLMDVPEGMNLYGTGEVAGPLERAGRRMIAWNTDAYAFDDESLSLYQSHPWVLALRADGSAFGLLADTTYWCKIDLRDGVHIVAEGPPFPIIVIEGKTPQEVLIRLTDLIGRMELPPKWALGYHQCRFSYAPDSVARAVARGFRDRDIPCDVIWHDIDYMDRFEVFSFDPRGFPDPRAHNAYLQDLGFKTIWMIDPGVGVRPGAAVYDDILRDKLYVKTAAGEPFQGKVWPGMCVFPDFTNAAVRKWWAAQYAPFLAYGIDGIWNDMNEPSVFESKNDTMPLDNRHDADAEFGGPGTHDRFHNVYGMLMVRATREGMLAARPNRRPFVLSRANFIGGHRYAAVWTGDNVADWYHLDLSIAMVLNLGLSGQPFSGPDIGGFKGPGDGEQFARWMGFGALLPFARGHTTKNNRDKEPWSFGPEVERACRLALERRYELLPYYYTLFREATLTGLPVVRPLFFADPVDPRMRKEDDAFLIGDDLLAFAQTLPKRGRTPVLPRGVWRPVRLTGNGHSALPEMFIRGGAIVPTGPVMEYTDEQPLDPLTLLVCLDEGGRARGQLYEDAGEGFGYRSGEYLLTTYEGVREGGRVTVRVAATEGRMQRPWRQLVVRIIEDGFETVASGLDGKEVTAPAGSR